MYNDYMIIDLSSNKAEIDSAGGKGKNLALLSRAGFEVPQGFIITTEAYFTYTDVNELPDYIDNQLTPDVLSNPAQITYASQNIRNRFAAGKLPLILETILMDAYQKISDTPIAVRSSATAEDLPEASFAGQQDTFLNVIGYENMKEAVINCWSSLWTPRAISYRYRNQIKNNSIGLAVVVQEMVQPNSSGVIFTANPLNGIRNQIVIDATYGLGEALVSGQVEPDHFVVENKTWEILDKNLGSKLIQIKSKPSGGVKKRKRNRSRKFSIEDHKIIELAKTGVAIQNLFRYPQDIEWAISKDKIHILQSRPITSLYPLPPDLPAALSVFFSFGAVQGMLDPMTPLGRDAIRLLFAGGASLLGYDATYRTQKVLYEAGGRLWGNITPLLQNTLGHRLIQNAMVGVEPGSANILQQLSTDERFTKNTGRPRAATIRRFIRLGLRFFPILIRNIINPDAGRISAIKSSNRFLNSIASQARNIEGTGTMEEKFTRRISLLKNLRAGFPIAVPTLAIAAASGLLSYNLIYRISRKSGVKQNKLLELFRGLPHNTTTEMDLALWQTARIIQDIPKAQKIFLKETPENITRMYLEQTLPPQAHTALSNFIEKYGMRGVAEIDFGRDRWSDNPAAIIQTLQNYLEMPENLAPDLIFRQSKKSAADALNQVLAVVQNTPLGFLKKGVIKWAMKRFKALAGQRESPKFFIIRFMGILRNQLLMSGKDLVMSGDLHRSDDLFYLSLSELEDFATGKLITAEAQKVIELRRAQYNFELRRKQVPRLFLSNGQVFYDTPSTTSLTDHNISGSPVSPGTIEGIARVVIDPVKAELQPGEIIICRGTDPAWTPLFLSAGGLVMEVGGMMTHGSVVAREYGIPAVAGVHSATTRIETGMKIRVDGSTGTISIIQD